MVCRPARDRSDKMAISTATLLAIISNKYVIGDSLPKLQYPTLCDKYIDFCFYLQILSILSFLLIYEATFIEVEGVGNLGDLLNEVAFSVQLFVTVAFHYWLGWRLDLHTTDINLWRTVLQSEKGKELDRAYGNMSLRRPSLPGCSFIHIANNSRLDLVRLFIQISYSEALMYFKDKLRFIEGCRRNTSIASFREAQIYGRTEIRDTIAAGMFQRLWRAYKRGSPSFNYAKFKIMLNVLHKLQMESRIVSFREALRRGNGFLAHNVAATMFQVLWGAYSSRKKLGIRRVSLSNKSSNDQ